MAVTNLLGTTWYFNDDPSNYAKTHGLTTKRFKVTYIAGDLEITDAYVEGLGGGFTFTYQQEVVETLDAKYGTTLYEWNHRLDWIDQSYRMITFTGGEDINDSDFVAWVNANAECLTPVEDLTGTTWRFKDTITNQAAVKGLNSIRYKVTYTAGSITVTDSDVAGNSGGFVFNNLVGAQENLIAKVGTLLYNYASGGWADSSYKTVTFNGGEDATNAEFITWVKANATALPSLVGTTWYFNETLTWPGVKVVNNLTFTAGSFEQTYAGGGLNFYEQAPSSGSVTIKGLQPTPQMNPKFYFWQGDATVTVGWQDESYRTITFTGGSGATNAEFVTWVLENAVLIPPPNEFSIRRETLEDIANAIRAKDSTITGPIQASQFADKINAFPEFQTILPRGVFRFDTSKTPPFPSWVPVEGINTLSGKEYCTVYNNMSLANYPGFAFGIASSSNWKFYLMQGTSEAPTGYSTWDSSGWHVSQGTSQGKYYYVNQDTVVSKEFYDWFMSVIE